MNILLVIVLLIIFSLLFFCIGTKFKECQLLKYVESDLIFGEIILDLNNLEDELLKIEFDKNPREMLDKNYICLEVKIRQ